MFSENAVKSRLDFNTVHCEILRTPKHKGNKLPVALTMLLVWTAT